MATFVSSTTATSGIWAAATPATFNYTLVNGSGNDRGVFVIVGGEDGVITSRPNSVAFNNTSMDLVVESVVDSTFCAWVQIWHLADADLPATSGSYEVSVVYAQDGGAQAQACYQVAEFSGMAQSTPTNFVSETFVPVGTVNDVQDTITPVQADALYLAAAVTGYLSNDAGTTGTLIAETDNTSMTLYSQRYQDTGSSDVTIEQTMNGTGNRAGMVIVEIDDPSGDEEVTETLEITESLAIDFTRNDAETLELSETRATDATISDQASLEITEDDTRSIEANFSESVQLGETTGPGLGFAETLEVTQSEVKDIDTALSETLEMTESADADSSASNALHRINSGNAASPYVDSNGNSWDVDRDFGAGTNTYTPGAVPIAGTIDDTIYQTSRGVVAAGGTFGVTYTLDVPDATEVTIRIHLCELFFTSVGARIFDILIDGSPVETDVDIFAEVGHDVALVKEFQHTTTSTSLVVKVQNGTTEKATINALEVLTADTGTQSATETLEVTESLAASATFSRAETLQLTETLEFALTTDRAETLEITEDTTPEFSGGGTAYTPSETETLQITESLQVDFTAARSETLNIFEFFDSPDDLLVDDTSPLYVTTDSAGDPSTATRSWTITNPTGYSIPWRARATAAWADIDREFGILASGESVTVTSTIDPTGLADDDYNCLVCIAGIDANKRTVYVTPINLIVGAGRTVSGTTYYIDYDSGSDSNNGTSAVTPFQHHPWDSNATSVANATTPGAGDLFIFRGGVTYRGTIYSGDSGSSGNPIVLDGNTRGDFGTGRAIIDGSALIGGWTDEGSGVFSSSVAAAAFFDVTPLGLRPFDGEMPMAAAQWPVKQPDVFQYDGMLTWPEPDSFTDTTLTYSGFADLPSDFADSGDVYIYGWAYQNRVGVARITGFNSSTNTITFEDTFDWITASSPGQTPRFVLVNSEAFLTDPGDFVVDETAETIKAIPYDLSDPSNITGAAQTRCLTVVGDYVDYRGLIVQKAGGSADAQGLAFLYSGSPENININACEIRYCPGQRATIYLHAGPKFVYIEGNAIHHNIKGRDIQLTTTGSASGEDGRIKRNFIFGSGGTAIFTTSSYGMKIQQNRVYCVRATHANGISAYADSFDCEITENRVEASNYGITVQPSDSASNMLVAYNVVHAPYNEFFNETGNINIAMAIYTPGSAQVDVFNNTLLAPDGQSFSLGSTGSIDSGVVVKNNIMEGIQCSADASAITSNNNVIVDPAGTGTYPLDSTDITETIADTLVDYDGGDFSLKAGSAAIDYAEDVGLTYVVQVGSAFDTGAFEYDANPIISETLEITESLVVDFVANASETLELTEQASAVEGGGGGSSYTESAAETLQITETLQVAFTANADETLQVAEDAAVGVAVSLAESLEVSEAAIVAVGVEVAESLDIAESSSLLAPVASATETLEISESIEVVFTSANLTPVRLTGYPATIALKAKPAIDNPGEDGNA